MSKPERICVFCGNPPEDKNLEHPLPGWLIKLTGDPNRVVPLGLNWRTGKPFRFAYDQLRFPSCSACNLRYAGHEATAKGLVERLMRSESLSAGEYVFLLDWLDKVRIGLWLGYRYLLGNPTPPNFTIDTRIANKDRMVAVYAFHDGRNGLSYWGCETPLFQFKPSVFALRANEVFLLNASWDWMCSIRCGYPYPTERVIRTDHPQGAMEAKTFRARGRVTHRIIMGLYKPCVLLFQPIRQERLEAETEGELPLWAREHWPARPNLGPVFLQRTHGTTIVAAEEQIAFDSVSDREAATLRSVASQTYLLQNLSVSRDFAAGPHARGVEKMVRSLKKYNKRVVDAHRTEATSRGEPWTPAPGVLRL